MFHNAIERARQARRRDEAGFTLIELLMVIVILGILAAVVVFSVRGINDRGETSACKANVATAETAVEAYYAKNGNYPANLAAAVPDFLHSDPSAATVDAQIRVAYDGSGGVTGGTAC
jgi:general secretion pathway protein G